MNPPPAPTGARGAAGPEMLGPGARARPPPKAHPATVEQGQSTTRGRPEGEVEGIRSGGAAAPRFQFVEAFLARDQLGGSGVKMAETIPHQPSPTVDHNLQRQSSLETPIYRNPSVAVVVFLEDSELRGLLHLSELRGQEPFIPFEVLWKTRRRGHFRPSVGRRNDVLPSVPVSHNLVLAVFAQPTALVR